jgi:choline-sulfatase
MARRRLARVRWAVLAGAVLAAAACGDGETPRVARPAPPPALAPPPSDAPPPGEVPPPPRLAATPRIDLAANAVRWHVYDAGLVVPVASEGLRKYDLEYRSPWGAVREVDGERGRVLGGRRATLTLPWDGGGAAIVEVRARGRGRLALAAGRRALGRHALDGSWQVLRFAVPAGALPAGEAALTLEAPAGTLVRSLELIPDGAAAGCGGAAPALGATAVGRPDALGGAARLALHLEIPAGAYLVAAPARVDGAAGPVPARVTVTAADGAVATLADGALAAREHVWSLAGFADQLVRLELESPGCDVRWDRPAVALAERPPAPPPAAAPQNLLLLVIDTLRADRLAVHGDTRVETPRLTAAARARGVVFRRNQAMSPSSPPSHATIHTGQIPRVHGAAGDTGTVGPGAPVLAAALGAAGFHTAYVGNNDFAMGRLAKAAGWDVARTMVYLGKGIDCAPMVEEVLGVVAAARDTGRRWFVTMLPIEPHVPYRYHPGITERYYAGPFEPPLGKRVTGAHLGRIAKLKMTPRRWEQLRGLYDGEVTYVDGCFGALEDGLAALGVLDDTAIVVTSDHGEGLGERGGRAGHAYGLHGELIDVPLIVLGGGLPAGAVDVVTSNLDLAPTALELLGLPVDPRMQGASLVPLARAGAPWPHRVVASEYGRSYALRGGRWRLVVGYDGRATLHDVIADPEEARDVSAEAPMARRWLREAAGLYLAHRVAWRAATWGNLADLAASAPLPRE